MHKASASLGRFEAKNTIPPVTASNGIGTIASPWRLPADEWYIVTSIVCNGCAIKGRQTNGVARAFESVKIPRPRM